MGKYKRYAQTSIVLALITTLAFAIGPTIRTLAAETIFKIQNAELTSVSDGAEGTIASFDESNIISNVVFHHLNDSATYKITLKNSDSKDHIIETITDDNSNSFIAYDYDKHENELIPADSDLIFDLTAKYSVANTDPSIRIQSTNVKFFIRFIDVEEPVEIELDVPNTGANTIVKTTAEKNHDLLGVTLPIVIISSIGLVIVAIIAVKKHKKFAKITAALVVTVAAAAIAAGVKAAVTEINSFTISTEYSLYDKLVVNYEGNDIVIDYGKKLEDVDEIVAPTKPGHTFTGWEDENGNPVDPAAPIVGDITIRPVLRANTYIIKYNGNGATSGEMATTNCEYDQTCALRDNAFEKYGYDFAGWKYNGNSYQDKADVTNIIESGTITMQAQWTPHVYHITYTGLTSEEATTLRAAGNPDTYTIEMTSFTLIKPADRKDADGDVREHCVGWRETTVFEDVTLPIINALSDKTYEAVWQTVSLEEYDITYNYDGGNVATANPTKLNKEQSATLNEPTKTGYTFTGWTGTTISGDTPVKPYAIPAPHQKGNLEYTAHYRANTYTVNFDINTDDTHVSGTMQPLTFSYDEEKTLTTNAFTRTGYTFAGWKDADNTEYTDGQTVKNLTDEDGATVTLKAQWTPTEYTIIFHANNENVENPDAMAAQVVTYDVETTLNPIEYTWWQHKLVEWTTNANDTGTKYADKATIKNLNANGGEVHLYAKWREIDAALQAGGVGRSPTGTRINTLLAANPDAKRFVKYTAGIPSDEVLANAVNTSGTIDPIWLWVEGENLYWWSEDVKPRISSRLTSTDCLFNGAGTYTVDGVTKHLEYADLTGFDTSNITDYGRTFHSSGILEINISDWDFSHATNMSEFIAWGSVKKAAFPEVVDARNVTNMSLALNFGMVTDELDLSGWKTRDVKNLSNFLSGMQAKKIKFSSDFKTNNAESMASMFSGNSRLTSIEGLEYFDTAKVKNMSTMFASVSSMESLDLSTFSTAALTNMKGMFSGMSSLTSLTLGGSFKANDVTDFTNTFKGLTKLQTIDLSNLTSTPTDMSSMFESSSGAKVIDISGMDLSAVTKFTYTFIACGNLETIYVSNNPNQENIVDDGHIFLYSGPKIVGGAGSNHLGSAAGTGNGGGEGQSVYARIDDPDNGEPGYFTYKNARYVRYHDNDGDDTNDEANYALMKSHYLKAGGSLAKNAFIRDGYVFTGWKDADNNEYTDEQVMADLVESKTPLELYAQWEKITAAITFDKNTDDTTYGTMAAQSIVYDTPTALTANTFDRGYYVGSRFYSGQRYEFRGWNKAADGTDSHYDDEAVIEQEFTENTTLYAEWYDLCRTFETDSWSTIISNLADDPMYYTPYGGCTKMVAIDMDGNGEDENYTVRLANTTTPEECAQSGYSQTGCGVVIEFVEDVDWRVVNSQNTNSGSWASTQLASWLNSDFYNKLPADLQSVIIPTYPIVTGTGSDGTSSDITKYDVDKNKIYLYSPKEIGIDNANDNRRDVATDTRILDYYTKHYNAVALSRNSEVINKNSNQWFTRTPVASAGNFYHAIVSGATYSSNANVGRGIAPVFRIGTPPSCRDFATDSWSTIVSNLESDPDYYSSLLGCQKEVEMDIVGSDGKWGSDEVNESYTVMLTNTSTPEECATAGFSQTACGTVIEFVDKVTERRWTNKSGTNAVAGGWKASELAGWLNGDFYEKLPDDLKQVIIPSYIVSSNAGGLESPDITLGDTNLNKIYLYSTKELGQPRTSTSNIEDNKIDSTRVADFYNIADNRSNYINRGSQLNNQWHSWWLRSSVLQRNNLPHDVQTVVTAGPGAENALGIFPVFRIGRTFTVTFDAGDGTPSEASREYATTTTTYGTLPTITTSPEGKTFAGWYTAAEGGEKVEDGSAFISDNAHTLYAHWSTPIQASPSLLYNDGKTINAKLKKLAGDNGADQNSHNFNIKAIKIATALPNGFTPTEANVISSASLDSNDHRIFAWFDAEANGGTIFIYNETLGPLKANSYSLEYIFYHLDNLVDLDLLADWDISAATTLEHMLSWTSITNLDMLSDWDTSNITNLTQTFSVMRQLTDISGLAKWNTSNVTHMYGLFSNSNKLEDISPLATTQREGYKSWDMSNVVYMGEVFYYTKIYDLEPLAEWNTSNVQYLDRIFSGTSQLWEVSPLATTQREGYKSWDVSHVVGMTEVFSGSGIGKINGLETWDISSAESLYRFLRNTNVRNIEPLRNWNVSHIDSFESMFETNTNYYDYVEDFSPIADWNIKSTANMTNMFKNIPNTVSRPGWYHE